MKYAQALYQFGGNPFDGQQISFRQGDIIEIDPSITDPSGWAYGRAVNSNTPFGWIPINYVKEMAPVSPAPAAFPPVVSPGVHYTTMVQHDEPSGFDFGGPVMGGGDYKAQQQGGVSGMVPFGATPSVLTNTQPIQNENETSPKGARIKNAAMATGQGISKAAATTGQGISKAAATTGQGISKAATTTGQGISKAATTTGKGIAGAFSGLGRKLSPNRQKPAMAIATAVEDYGDVSCKAQYPTAIATATATNNTSTPRSAREQKKVDIGNGAARGAAVGGAVGLVMGGPRGAVSGAKYYGAWGGANAAVRGWKPFG